MQQEFLTKHVFTKDNLVHLVAGAGITAFLTFPLFPFFVSFFLNAAFWCIREFQQAGFNLEKVTTHKIIEALSGTLGGLLIGVFFI